MAPEDDALERLLEDRITEVYNQAAAEVTRKWEKYMEDFARKDKAKQQLVKSGKLPKDEYLKWRKGQVLVGNRWAEMRDVLSKDMLNADKIAVSIINDFMPEAYAIGHNYGTFEIESGSLINTSYTLYSRETVERLIKDQPRLLNVTKWELDAPKDKRWNQQHITQQITQGILQGEDIRQVSKRLQNVVGMDKGAAMRNARTAMTGAQNGGRLDAYKRAVDMGIKAEKEWLATLDASTRDSHIDMDGEHVPVDETFSNSLQFPGEMGGPPAEVYNCRCTLIPRLADVDYSKDNDLRWRRDEDLGDMSYDEWKETHEGRYERDRNGYGVKNLYRPERPRKNNFDSDEAYYAARDAYMLERQEYNKQLEKAVEDGLGVGEFETADDFSRWASRNGISIDPEVLKEIDPRAFKETSTALEEMFKRFPEVKSYSFELFTGETLQSLFGIGIDRDPDALLSANGGFNFNPRFFSDYSHGLLSALQGMTDGSLVRGDGKFSTLVRHEFGHNVQAYIESALAGKYHHTVDDWRLNFSTFAEYKEADKAYWDEHHSFYDELRALAGLDGSSDYSNTNDLELFAEGFAEYTSGSNSDFAVAFGKFLERWYK